MDVEDMLRGHFADQAHATPDPAPDLLPRAFARRRARRRRLAVGTAVVAACAAVVVAVVPAVTGAGPSPSMGVAAPGDPELLQAPSRGSLADDAAFLAAIADAPWEHAAPERRHVAFAGDVPGGRWALVLGERQGAVVGQWFTGPAGAAVDQLLPDNYGPAVSDGSTFTRVEPTSPAATFVVVAPPGQTVEISPRAVVAADGTVTRSYTAASPGNGVAVGQLDSMTRGGTASGARYRLVSSGTVGASTALYANGGGRSFDPPQLTAVRPGSSAASPEAVDQALAQVGGPTGLEDDELSAQLLWAGPVTNDGQTADVAVLAAELPSGAVAVSTAWAQINGDGSGSAAACGTQLFPAGTPVEGITAIADCAGMPGTTSSAYVIAPDSDQTLTLTGPGGVRATVQADRTEVRTDLPPDLTKAIRTASPEAPAITIARPAPDDVFDLAD